MTSEQTPEAYCQSCGMPIAQPELQGTEADDTKSEDYCVYCYQNGQFTQPDATLEEMIEISAQAWAEQDPNVNIEQAKAQLAGLLPSLERWSK